MTNDPEWAPPEPERDLDRELEEERDDWYWCHAPSDDNEYPPDDGVWERAW